jgi:hypothetical protein
VLRRIATRRAEVRFGGWLTFDVQGNAVWLHFHESRGWTGPLIYTARHFRNNHKIGRVALPP